jgi:hypothetical protein
MDVHRAARIAAAAHGGHLPTLTPSFVGREAEIDDTRNAPPPDDVRLVSLTRPGGSGETRLAIQAAGRLVDAYADGLCWTLLADVVEARGMLRRASVEHVVHTAATTRARAALGEEVFAAARAEGREATLVEILARRPPGTTATTARPARR